MFKVSTIIGRTGFNDELAQKLTKNARVNYSANGEVYALAIGRIALREIVERLEENERKVFSLDDVTGDDIYEIEAVIDGELTVVGWEIEVYATEIDNYYAENDFNV